MPIDSLLHTVKTLQQRIAQHGDFLKGNETRTRYALIDPLLTALGWDVFDPSCVATEFPIPETKDRGDYALLGNDGKPIVIIETKRLGVDLSEALKQGVNYCALRGYEYCAVTDGNIWELYETRGGGDISERRVMAFSISDDTQSNDFLCADVCLKALALWRPAVMAGAIQEGQASVLDTGSEEVTPLPPPPPLPNGWKAMTDPVQTGAEFGESEIRFPDGTIAQVSNRPNFFIEVVKWLVQNHHLRPEHCPDKHPKGKNYRIALEPIHPSGKPFSMSAKVANFHVNKIGLYGSNNWASLRESRRLIERLGLDPSQFTYR